MKNIWNYIQDSSAQGTVEFAIVTAAFLIIVIAISAFWNLSEDGILIEHAIKSASHQIENVATGFLGDVFSC